MFHINFTQNYWCKPVLLQPICFQDSASLIYSSPPMAFLPHKNMALEITFTKPHLSLSYPRCEGCINPMALGTEMGTCRLVTGEGPFLPALKPAPGQPRAWREWNEAPKPVCFWNMCLLGFFVGFYVLNHRKLSGWQCVPSISVPRSVYIKHPTKSHRECEISSDTR